MLEASELLEIFQWIPENDLEKLDDRKIEHIKDEIADVFIYLVAMCDKLKAEFYEVVLNKLEKTAKRYPVKE